MKVGLLQSKSENNGSSLSCSYHHSKPCILFAHLVSFLNVVGDEMGMLEDAIVAFHDLTKVKLKVITISIFCFYRTAIDEGWVQKSSSSL